MLDWRDSGRTFHVMRDHTHHNVVMLGGMFGEMFSMYHPATE